MVSKRGLLITWDADSGERLRACGFPSRPEVSPEGHLAVTTEPEIRLWDATNGRLNGTIVLLADDRYVAIGPFGDFDGSPGVEKSLVYVTEANGVQETLSPAEFQGRFRHNDERGAHLARRGPAGGAPVPTPRGTPAGDAPAPGRRGSRPRRRTTRGPDRRGPDLPFLASGAAMHETTGEPHGADPAGRGDPGHRGIPDHPGPEFARLMAEKGESLRRYVRNEARSALAAEVRDGKVPAISKRLRPAMADAILQGRFSELPPEVREAINSRLASGPQGWWTPGPLAVFDEVLASDRKGWHPGALVVFWGHLEREPHLSNDWETFRALRDLAERESIFEAHRPAAHDLEALLAAAKTTAGTKPRETSIGIWILFLIALLPTLIALYYKTTAPPERPGEGPGASFGRGSIRIGARGSRTSGASPAGIWGQGARRSECGGTRPGGEAPGGVRPDHRSVPQADRGIERGGRE